ncbi:MAG: 2-oxoacid:acceptor oxidoreductase family protein [Planctomycetota bacterium]|jgi:pyruvate ferredoxin oxidoreductase gamma subunit
MESSRTRRAPPAELHEIRLVGRGGTGVVTAGEVLGKAAVVEGRWAQAIPTFGPERRGALSSCTLRISGEEILLKCGTIRPDVLLVIDRTIWRHAPVTGGLAEGAALIFNTPASPAELAKDLRLDIERYELFTVDANAIALEFLGRAITNTAMMGALSGATRLLSMESIGGAIRERFGKVADKNIAAAEAARDRLRKLGD